MTVIKQKRALLVKLLYQNGDSTTEALRKSLSLKRLRKGPPSSKGIRNMLMKFGATGLAVEPGRGRRYVVAQALDDVSTRKGGNQDTPFHEQH